MSKRDKSSTPAGKRRASSTDSSIEPRKHVSKACEYCRGRRIKCVGGIPCEACVRTSRKGSCQVRSKARPSRPAALKQSVPPDHPVETVLDLCVPLDSTSQAGPSAVFDDHGFLFAHTTVSDTAQQSSPAQVTPQHPLAQIENALSMWCFSNNVPFAPLIFGNVRRLSTLTATPLPSRQERVAFEDGLITHLITAVDFDQHGRELRTIDRPRLLSLYGRYRAVPNSLTDDQRALIFASMCLARHTQISTPPNGPHGGGLVNREDVTYYRMACEMLDAWGRPSIYSVWALFCLVPYTTALGGPAESANLLRQMGSHIQDLGLHKISSAQWYAPEDMVQVIFSAYLYMDLLRASITDLQTFVPLSEIEVDATPPQTFVPENLRQASRDAMDLLRALNESPVDTMSNHYIEQTEIRWEAVLRVLRQDRSVGTLKAKAGWAMIRYHWMRILLHYPRHHQAYPTSTIILARSVTQIIHIYSQLAAYGYLNPSWPQLKRISVCGQLIILLAASGEIGQTEGSQLVRLYVPLLDGHAPLWPLVQDMKSAFRQAAHALGLDCPDTAGPLVTGSDVGGLGQVAESSEEMAWQSLSLMFDPACFLSMTHDDLFQGTDALPS